MRSSNPHLNVERYRPEHYRRNPVRHNSTGSVNRKFRNLIAPLGLVLGILAVAGAWIPFLKFLFPAIAIPGIIISTIGFVKSKRSKLNKSEALIGLALSGVAVLLFFINYAVYSAARPETVHFDKAVITATTQETLK